MQNWFVFISLLAFSALSWAGAGHHHQLTEAAATKKATEKLNALIEKGKLDKSWTGVKVKTVQKKTFKKGPEWVVTFFNEKAGDKSKQTLYMFYDLDGHYLAANFSGN